MAESLFGVSTELIEKVDSVIPKEFQKSLKKGYKQIRRV